MSKPMNFRHLDLNLLVALDALLLDRSITQAGKRVHLSQSAMSGALSRLREYFGDEILTQIGRRMIPTPLGESLATPVRKLLLEIQTTIATQPKFDPATATRTFRLMMSDYVSTVLMSVALPVIEQMAPSVSIEILSVDVESPFEELNHADIDLLIMPQCYLNDAQPYEVLFQDDFVGITWKDNSLIPADGRLSLEAFMSLGHVTSRFARARAATVDDWFVRQLDYKRNVEVVTMNFTSIVSSIPGTKRVATIHRRFAEYFAQYLPIRLFETPFEVPRLTEAVQWHRHFSADPGLLWLRGILNEASRNIMSARHPASARVVPFVLDNDESLLRRRYKATP